MTAEKLYGILLFIDDLDSRLSIQNSLQQVATALANLVASPAQPQYQTQLAQALTAFDQSVSKMNEAISHSQFQTISTMGGEEFFNPRIAENVRNSVEKNAMTPSVASDYVQSLLTNRAAFLSTVKNAAKSLKQLGIKEVALEVGTADISFLIPRDIFNNELGSFSRELSFLNQFARHYSEALTGQVEVVKLEELSSSTPTVALWLSAKVIEGIGKVVNLFLDAWEKIERIRKIRSELVEMGLKDTATELTEQITTTVEEVVEESTQLVLAEYKGKPERRSELENAVKIDTLRLFGQIERGLSIEIRANRSDSGDGDGELQKSLGAIQNMGAGMKFPLVTKEPMLLGSGELIEGDIIAAKHSKTTKTTTKTSKTTTSAKKAPAVEVPEKP